jgi:hypothetical protein
MQYFRFLVSCSSLVALAYGDETPLPLGASDLSPDPRVESFKPSTAFSMDLEKAFEVEAIEQLDLEFEVEATSELEVLKRENEALKHRVSKLESRLAVIEAKLAEE